MRVLSGNTYEFDDMMGAAAYPPCDGTAGEESHTFELPAGFSITHETELNGSSTLKFYDPNGIQRLSWNSGTFVSCWLFGVGIGGIVTGFTAQPSLGSLAAGLASLGCSTFIKRTMDDGDSYIPDC